MSEDTGLVLYFIPEYRLPLISVNYLALYTKNDVEAKAFTRFGPGRVFVVYDLSGEREMMLDNDIYFSRVLLGGRYRVVGDEIHLTPLQYYPDRSGVNTTIFLRTEDYSLIDPYYWFPEFFPRSE